MYMCKKLLDQVFKRNITKELIKSLGCSKYMERYNWIRFDSYKRIIKPGSFPSNLISLPTFFFP